MAAAEEVYRRQERRSGRRKSGKPAPDSSDEQLVQAYLECLNAMPVEEFLALELKGPAARDVVTPGPSVTPSNDRPTGQAKSPPISS